MFLFWVTDELMVLLANCWRHSRRSGFRGHGEFEISSNRQTAWSPLYLASKGSMITLYKEVSVEQWGMTSVLMIP